MAPKRRRSLLIVGIAVYCALSFAAFLIEYIPPIQRIVEHPWVTLVWATGPPGMLLARSAGIPVYLMETGLLALMVWGAARSQSRTLRIIFTSLGVAIWIISGGITYGFIVVGLVGTSRSPTLGRGTTTQG